MENNTQIKISTPMAIIIAGFLIMLGIIITKSPGQIGKVKENKLNGPQASQIVLAPVLNNEHIRGDLKTAEVLIVEFSDTECPWCKKFHPTLKQIIEKYAGKVAWVYRHSPIESLHSKARNEARATECVNKIKGNDVFWQYLDTIYENTPANNGLDPNLLLTYAEKVGITPLEFNKCMVDNRALFDKLIDASIADGQNAGLEGTPHSIIVTKDGKQYPIKGADEAKLNTTLETLLK